MAEPVRVRSKSTGHEYTTFRFDPEAMELVKGGEALVDGVVAPPVLNEKVASRKAPEATDTPSQPGAGPSTV